MQSNLDSFAHQLIDAHNKTARGQRAPIRKVHDLCVHLVQLGNCTDSNMPSASTVHAVLQRLSVFAHNNELEVKQRSIDPPEITSFDNKQPEDDKHDVVIVGANETNVKRGELTELRIVDKTTDDMTTITIMLAFILALLVGIFGFMLVLFLQYFT